jgi:hypothetical protein
LAGKALRRCPGVVAPVEIHDELSGTDLAITVGPLLTKISVNGRDFYFDRFSGRYDGTGSGCG